MPVLEPRIDAYIAKSADFARPILLHLRKIMHRVCPDVEETIKWRHPTFMHRGLLCAMAAFKQHCALGFWKEKLVFVEGQPSDQRAHEQLGRITNLKDLPADKILAGYIRKAMQLNESSISARRTGASPKPAPKVPDDLARALKTSRKALENFDAFSPSNKREYIDWINDAKRDETRAKRLDTAMEWIAQGKPRNWKYMNC